MFNLNFDMCAVHSHAELAGNFGYEVKGASPFCYVDRLGSYINLYIRVRGQKSIIF